MGWSNEVLRFILDNKKTPSFLHSWTWISCQFHNPSHIMSAIFSALLETITVCLIYKDNITLMSTQCVTWAGFMSIWISVEKHNVRLYKYCSLLLYHSAFFIGQITWAVETMAFFVYKKISLEILRDIEGQIRLNSFIAKTLYCCRWTKQIWDQ